MENQNFWQYHSMSSTQQFCAKYLLEWDFLCLKAVYCTAHNILWWFSLFLIVDYYNTVFMLKRCFSKKRKNTGKSHRIATFQFCSSTWSDFTFASIFVKHKQGNRLAHHTVWNCLKSLQEVTINEIGVISTIRSISLKIENLRKFGVGKK